MDFFVKALEIKNWAAKSEASLELPHLLRRLVCGTVTELEACDFPAYESTYKPGFDGVVRCKQGNAWVPSNVSVWEMGKDAGVATKANKDFKKRTKSNALSMEEKKETTFVFVTPREWKNKTDWAREKNKIGIWKEVRAYDATNLEQWLETTKAVTIWFGRKIGSRPLYVDDIESRWQAIANSAEHILVPELFLAGRAESQTSLSNWLDAEAGCLTVQTRSPKEVTDFFCAFVESFEADRRVELQSRTIIVENRDAWKILVDCHPANLIVEPTFELESDEITKAIANGHHVLRAVEPSTACSGNAISLERSPQFELSQFLEKSGYSPVVSQQHARAAGGSLAILKHRLAVNPSNLEPDWISEADSTIVTACLLLGGWNGLNEADRNAFAQLANRPYEEAEAKLQELANCTDPLLLNAAGCWRLISKDHAWAIFQSRISSDALNRFADLAVEILADDDPKYELPDDKRAFANIYGHTPMYSPIVKKHVAETLALLGAFGDGFAVASNTNIPATLARVVQHVLSPNATWHRWATLGIRLAMLAEASPKDFIKSVKAELSKSDSEFKKLLDDDGDDTMFSGCKHAGLLWALELLAWPKTHLLDAATSLMDLAKIDPGGRWGNRPMSSLNGILLHWIPHTTANVAERIQVLDRLIELDSEVPWRLLVSLLPQHLGHSDSAQQPYWRDWANDWVRGATRKESIEFCNAVARRVIEQADTDPDRWLKIFENVGLFPFDSRESFLSAAHRFAETQLSDENRRQVSEVLFEHIHRHRRHPNADWSIPKEILHELDKVLEKLQPKTASVRHAWLFKPYPDRFFRDGDVSKGEERLKEARANAITEIISKERFAGVLSLAEKAEAANCVGVALSETTEDKYVDALIPDLISEPDWQLDLIRGFVWNRWYPDNWDWVGSMH